VRASSLPSEEIPSALRRGASSAWSVGLDGDSLIGASGVVRVCVGSFRSERAFVDQFGLEPPAAKLVEVDVRIVLACVVRFPALVVWLLSLLVSV
jgi:hypothetical protein